MENQPINNQAPVSPLTLPVKTKTYLSTIGITALVCAIVFGLGGFYLGKKAPVVKLENEQSSVNVTPPPEKITPLPSPITSNVPSPTAKPLKKLTYNLPAGWKTVVDASGRLEVGYDPTRYNALAKNNQIDLSGIWVGTQGSDLRRLGWNRNFYLTSYSGGSRHSELYKILGISANSSNWKSPEYSEKEYLYSGWNCLVLNGINISQYPVAWGYCPISAKEALVLAFDGPDWSEIEQQMAAVKLLL